MADELELFKSFSNGFAELPKTFDRVGKLANKQEDIRREIVLVIHRLGDALKAAGDHITVAISEQKVGF